MDWNIYENPKLNFEPFCKIEFDSRSLDFNLYGNLKDCGCNRVRVNSRSLPYYPNCTFIDGGSINGLQISNISQDVDLSGFWKLEKIAGRLVITNTNIQNLSFLANLETIDMSSSSVYDIIYITDNPKLKSLGFDSLKNLKSNENEDRLSVYLAGNHPNFCISIHELQLFADNEVNFELLLSGTEICRNWEQNDKEKICEFVDLKAMDLDCRRIVGNVVVNSSNENDAWRLGNVTIIYGSITVRSTEKLLDLSFLSNLEQVGATQYFVGGPLIQIKYNEKLQTVTLPKLKRLFPLYVDQVMEIKSNAFNIFKNKTECLAFQKATKTIVEYNGSSCNKFKQTNSVESPGFHLSEIAFVTSTFYIWLHF
ncbi:unnamed protein product [Caenorhabditis brenneri]